MLVKCETKSNRVKGLSFHPKLSWILASLHNGTIQLWDYRIGSLIEKFEEHDGPVRGVCFHLSQPLFVSGGDDYKIKVWNYKMRRCIFTLLGHLDYIRTVSFHDEYPWILSCSDDQTVRIWNWQSRSCIAVLTGHNHYVMCAHFHPKEDLVVSASLDQTVRVWDTSGLREKTVSIGGSSNSNQTGDVFGTSDAVVKYVLEGHDRGVNWASFHPTLPLIVSGADDRLIKLWRMNDTKAWEVDTLRGHFNNVSCVIFHPNKDLIISNSEDRTIRVWDVTKRTGVHTFRRENDRFWIVTAHRFSNLLAVGHDAGMVVFKLDRERPLFALHQSQLYHVKDRDIHLVELDKPNLEGQSIAVLRKPPNAMLSGARTLHYNPYNSTEVNILVFHDQDGGAYDLFTCPADRIKSFSIPISQQGSGKAVAFITRNRFAVLQKDGSVGVYNLSNELSKKLDVPIVADQIYPGGNNRILLRGEDKMVMYDVTARKVVGEVGLPANVRYISWSSNFQHLAIIAKHNLVLCGKNMEYHHTFHETIRVKSGAWDENGVFVFATLSHVKYAIPNGDSGIIHSLPSPIYIVRVLKQKMWYIDREHNLQKQDLNCAEYMFKLSLHRRNFPEVQTWLRNGRICGNVVIGYLKKKGFPEVALHFVEDQQTRFNLALEYGHIEEAMKAAQELDDKTCWSRLGTEALRQGNQQIVEMVYQRTVNFDALSFLYLITGNRTKLKKMLSIATDKRKDVMSTFNNALMLGNVEERVKALAAVGQVPLAALTARTYGLHEFVQALEDNLTTDVCSAIPSDAACLIPPTPILRTQGGENANWPLLTSTQKIFEDHLANAAAAPVVSEEAFHDIIDEAEVSDFGGQDMDVGDEWGGGLGDLDLGDMGDLPDLPEQSLTVSCGDPWSQKWLKNRKLVCDLVAAGEFEEALQLLVRRIGLKNAGPLKPLFQNAFMASSCTLSGLPQTPLLTLPLLSKGSLKDTSLLPITLYNIPYLLEQLKEAHRLTTAGKFGDALATFRQVLQAITLSCATSAEEEQQLNEFIDVCREYVIAMRLETVRRETQDVVRNLELSSYMTCCKLQPMHLLLTLRVAMTLAFKAQNFITAALHARRLLQGNFGSAAQKAQDVVTQARKVLQACEMKGTDAHEIRFDAKAVDNLSICAMDLAPLAATAATQRCPFCASTFGAAHKGKLCPTCELSEIGANTLGVQFRPL